MGSEMCIRDRIQSDYEFVCSDITWEAIEQRVKAYKELDALA